MTKVVMNISEAIEFVKKLQKVKQILKEELTSEENSDKNILGFSEKYVVYEIYEDRLEEICEKIAIRILE